MAGMVIAVNILILSQSFLRPVEALSPTPIALKITDAHGISLTKIATGQQVTISNEFSSNYEGEQQPFIGLFEIRNSDGVTAYLAWQMGIIEPGGHTSIGFSWMPEMADTYEIRAFAITNLENPEVLMPIRASQVEVLEKIDLSSNTMWLALNTTQCSNPWDNYIREDFRSKSNISDSDIEQFYIDYFYDTHEIVIYDVHQRDWLREAYGEEGIGVCSACSCTSGITLYLLVSYNDIGKMPGLDFKVVESENSTEG